MTTFLKSIHRFVDHPLTRFVMGLILVASSIAEGYDTFFDDVRHVRLRAHHGLFLLGLSNVLAALPDLVEGLEKAVGVFAADEEASADAAVPADPRPD